MLYQKLFYTLDITVLHCSKPLIQYISTQPPSNWNGVHKVLLYSPKQLVLSEIGQHMRRSQINPRPIISALRRNGVMPWYAHTQIGLSRFSILVLGNKWLSQTKESFVEQTSVLKLADTHIHCPIRGVVINCLHQEVSLICDIMVCNTLALQPNLPTYLL